MVLGHLFHVTPSNFSRRILRSEALVYKSYLDLVSVVRIRESPYYEVFFFLKKIYENFIGTVETVRIREVSVPRGIVLF